MANLQDLDRDVRDALRAHGTLDITMHPNMLKWTARQALQNADCPTAAEQERQTGLRRTDIGTLPAYL